MDWPADAVERRAVASLVPYARNARTHSDEQVEQLAASINEWGWTMPVLVDEAGGVIAGHGRILAANKLGIAEVPVMVARGWTDAQKRAYVIADNKLTLNAGWDEKLLSLEVADLASTGFDLPLIGFSERELRALVGGSPGLTDPDDAPPLSPDLVARSGEVWKLGDHRLVCGDATNAANVASALGNERPHLMVTDPPYGVEYDPNWRNEYQEAVGEQPTYKRSVGTVNNDDRRDWRGAWELFPGDVAYVWHADRQASTLQASLESVSFAIRCQIIWAKNRFIFGRGNYHWQHEPCWYAVKGGAKAHWGGDHSQTTLWQIDRNPQNETGHSTQKPIECMKRPIENNSEPGDAVYDPFVGSGTTIIAAEMTGRRCLAIEISPLYVDVAIRRWQAFTGHTAMREIDGTPFETRQTEAA